MVTAIIQARLGSTRLPKKVFRKICDRYILEHIISRIKNATLVSDIIVATTTCAEDDAIEYWCAKNKIKCFRGSAHNVLQRYYETARHFNVSYIARITSDDPFKDPKVIDIIADKLVSGRYDFVYNNHPPSYPEGLDVELFTFDALALAYKYATTTYDQEHVTQYMYKHPEKFRQVNVSNDTDLSKIRLTVDTQEDLELATKIYNELYEKNQFFYLDDIISLLNNNPEWLKINESVERSSMFKSI